MRRRESHVMPARRIFAWLIYAALTAPIGLFAHFAFEAYSRRDGGFSPFEPDHLAWLTVIARCSCGRGVRLAPWNA